MSLMQRCQRLSYRLWQFFVLLLVLLALLVSGLRLLAPHVGYFKQPIQQWVANNYQMQLDFSQFNIEWHHFGLYLTLDDVALCSLQSPDEKVKRLQSFSVRFEPWSSLLEQQVRLSDIQLQGLELELSPRQNKQQKPFSWSKLIAELTNERFDEFLLTDAHLSYDTGSSHQTFIIPSLAWSNKMRPHQGKGSIHLAGFPKQSASFIVDITRQGEQFQGQLYLNVEHLSPQALLQPLLNDSITLVHSEFNFQAWVDFTSEQLSQAKLILGDNQLRWQHQSQSQERQFSVQQGALLLRGQADGWQLQGMQLAAQTNDYTWPRLELVAAQQDKQLSVQVQQVDLAAVTPLLELVPALSAKFYQWPQPTSGQLHDLRWQQNDANSWQLSGQLAHAAWPQTDKIPSASDFNAQFSLSPNGLQAKVELPAQTIQSGGNLPQPIKLKQLYSELDVTWQQAGWQVDIPQFQLQTDALTAEIAARIRPNEKQQTQLFLYGELALSKAENAWHYFPQRVMSDGLVNYLHSALQGGHVDDSRLLWHGAFADFPYAQGAGKFQVDVPLKAGTFKFQSNWPALSPVDMTLLFDNRDLLMAADKAYLLDAEVNQLQANILELGKHSVLQIDGSIVSQAESVREVMNASMLAGSVGKALDSLRLQGPVSGPISLTIPLDGKAVKARGYAELSDAQLVIPGTDHPLTHANGRVYYQESDIQIEDLTARYHQLPVTVNVTGGLNEQKYDVHAQLQGQWPAAGLAQIPQLTLPSVTGELVWQGDVKASVGKEGVSSEIRITSDLVGFGLNLPEPLNKAATSSWPLEVAIDLSPDYVMTGRAVVGDQLFAMWQQALTKPDSRENYVWAGLGTQQPLKGTPTGVTVDIRLPKLNLTPWLNLPSSGSGGSKGLPFQQGIWQIDALELFGYGLSDTELRVQAQGPSLQVDVVGPKVRGEVRYSNLSRPKVEVIAHDLQIKAVSAEPATVELTAEPSSGEAKPSEDKPSEAKRLAAMPDLAIHCLHCQVDDLFFDEVKLSAQADLAAEQWVAQEAWATTGGGKITFDEFVWQLNAEQSQTQGRGTLVAADFDEMTRSLFSGVELPVKDSPLQSEFHFGWAGAPQDFNVSALDAEVDWTLGEGHLAEVSDKGARVFTLLSMNSLVRKIRLDFSDLFAKGLFYNEMSGNFVFKDGVVSSKSITMDGVAGDMTISGQTDLKTRQLDYDVAFHPDLTASLPLLAGLTINPVTGIYVLALHTVIKPVIEVVTQVRFKVTGTMDEPLVDEVERKKKSIKVQSPEPPVAPAKPATPTTPAVLPKPASSAPTAQLQPQPNSTTASMAPKPDTHQLPFIEMPVPLNSQTDNSQTGSTQTGSQLPEPLLPELPAAAPITVGSHNE